MSTIKYNIYISFCFTILTACEPDKPQKTNLPPKPDQEDLKKNSNPSIVISATGPGSKIYIESNNTEHTGSKISQNWKEAIKLSNSTADNQNTTTQVKDSIKITANNGAEVYIHSRNIPDNTNLNNETPTNSNNNQNETQEEETQEEEKKEE